MSYKTIKEVIKLTGTTEKALRYYDDKGLLSPSKKRETGRREWLYDDDAIGQIKLIMLYRNVGFSVDEIEMLLSADSDARRSAISCKIRQLSSQRRELDTQISIAGMLLVAEKIGVGGEERDVLCESLEELRGELKGEV